MKKLSTLIPLNFIKTKMNKFLPQGFLPIPLLFILGFMPFTIQSQETYYLEEWYETTGATNDLAQISVNVVDNQDNLYVATSSLNGSSDISSFPVEYYYDVILTKYEGKGNKLWEVNFNVGSKSAFLADLTLDDNQNPIIAGSVYEDTSQNYEGFVAKYNTSGTLQWDELFSGTANEDDGAKEIFTLNNDVFVVGGVSNTNTQFDLITVKYNSTGVFQWSKIYDHAGLNDAALLVTGNTTSITATGIVETSSGTYEQVTASYNTSTGAVIQTATTQGILAVIQEVKDAIMDDSGNIFITGAAYTSQAMVFKTLKLNTQMQVEWTQTYQATGSEKNIGNAITLDNNGNVYVTGYSLDATHNSQMTTIKYSSTGVEQWVQSTTGGIESSGNDIVVNSNNEVFVSGSSIETASGNTDFKLIQLDANGNDLWKTSFNGIYNNEDEASQIILDTEGNILVSGTSKEDSGNNTYLTVKYNREELIIPPDDEPMSSAFNYVENKGQLLNTNSQVANEIKFYTNNQSPSLYFHNDMISMVAASIDTSSNTQDTMHRVDMIFNDRVDVRERLRVSPLEKREDYFNYYLGHIQEGREAVRLFDQLSYPQIYNGIDALYSSNGTGLKYYFVCHPNADPDDIELTFEGQNSLAVVNGNLVIGTSLGNIVLPQPIAYKIVNGVMVEYEWIPIYSVSANVVTISSGSFDGGIPLVFKIGTTAITTAPTSNGNNDWTSYYGGGVANYSEVYEDIKTDLNNNVAVAGYTHSTTFPATSGAQQPANAGAQDGFLTVFKDNTERRFSTYFGGSNWDFVSALETDNAGNIYIVGETQSTNFPKLDDGNVEFDGVNDCPMFGVCQDAFISKFSATGMLSFSTYWGKSDTPDRAFDIKKNNQGEFYVVGFGSPTLKNTSGEPLFQTVGTSFISKFDTDFSLLWSSHFGDGDMYIHALAIDDNDNVFLTGQSQDSDFDVITPTSNSYGEEQFGNYDAFMAKITDSPIDLVWFTYFGGVGEDKGYGIETDSDGNVYMTGYTKSSDLDVLDNNDVLNSSISGTQDCIISQFDNDGVQLFTSYLGSNGFNSNFDFDWGYDVEVDNDDNVYFLGGVSNSLDSIAPLEFNQFYFQDEYGNTPSNMSNNDGSSDGFIAMMDKTMSSQWITYFGGRETDNIQGSTISANGKLYITGLVTNHEWNNPFLDPTFPFAEFDENADSDFFQNSFSSTQVVSGGYIARFVLEGISTDNKELFNSSSNLFKVYPNPSADKFWVSINEKRNDIETIEVRNLIGQLILQKKITSLNSHDSSIELDLTGLNSGLYVIYVKSIQDDVLGYNKIIKID